MGDEDGQKLLCFLMVQSQLLAADFPAADRARLG